MKTTGKTTITSFLPEIRELMQDRLQDLHPGRGDVKLMLPGFDVEHKEIRMIVLLYPTSDPAQGMVLLGKTPAGLVAQPVVGVFSNSMACFTISW